MPGMNRNTRRLMERMNAQELPNVQEVIIKTDKKELVLSKPSVMSMEANDQSVYTITGKDFEERELEQPVFTDDDIEMVCTQSGASRERAIETLTETDGNIAQAIVRLKP